MYYDENSLEESYTVVDHKGSVVHTAYSEGEAKKKAMELSNKSGKPHKVAFSRTATVKEDLDEMDFGSIGKTLSKYGKGVGDATPKTPSRSKVNTNYTMTGHREGQRSTGRVYTKVQDDDSDAKVAARATEKPDQVEAPKRGRGRPAGAFNKQDVKKGWSDEAKASMKAKLAARKAAKLAAANESELDEDDWSSIVEGMSLNSIVEFMLDEDFAELDEISKEAFGSYMRGDVNEGFEKTQEVRDHAKKAGARNASSVQVFQKKDTAISFAKNAMNKPGGVHVMAHPQHDYHVVVNGADASDMAKNGYKHISVLPKNESIELEEQTQATKQRVFTDSISYYASKLTANLIKE